jgi:hypothetical protein
MLYLEKEEATHFDLKTSVSTGTSSPNKGPWSCPSWRGIMHAELQFNLLFCIGM